MGLKDSVSFAKDHVCRACVEGKMHDISHPSKTIISSKRILELLCRRGEQTDAMGWLKLGPMYARGSEGGKSKLL